LLRGAFCSAVTLKPVSVACAGPAIALGAALPFAPPLPMRTT
jgi:hypothetical protein